MAERKRTLKNIVWPPVDTPGKAKLARLPVLCLAVFTAVLWSVLAIAGFFSEIHNWYRPLLAAPVWILIASGLYAMRREAAVAGFILSVYILGRHWGSWGMIGDCCLLLLYLYAVRGTFAYARMHGREVRSPRRPGGASPAPPPEKGSELRA